MLMIGTNLLLTNMHHTRILVIMTTSGIQTISDGHIYDQVLITYINSHEIYTNSSYMKLRMNRIDIIYTVNFHKIVIYY